MEKCPKCGQYSVDYNPYKKSHVCMIDGCSCVVINSNSYSFLKINPTAKTIDRVKVEDEIEIEVVKKYNCL